MLISKFSAASVAVFLVAPCALAQTETRLPEVGVAASRGEAQGQTPLVTSTEAITAAPLRKLAASVVVIPKEILRAQSALPLDDAIFYASSPSLFDNPIAANVGADSFGFPRFLSNEVVTQMEMLNVHIVKTMPAPATEPLPTFSEPTIGLFELERGITATVAAIGESATEQDRELVLRLIEIGFVPGETLRVIAHGQPGNEPIAVRLGGTTFALRRIEADYIRVIRVPAIQL